MKRVIRKTISMILSLLIIITMSGWNQGKKVSAATKKAVKTQCTTYEGSNVGAQNYSRWTNPVKSYLTAQDDGSFMRVQYGSNINGLLVEYYDKDYNLTSTKIIDEELPVFGGFYATDDNYYVVTGENNKDEDNDLEVYRITKYDKKWNKIGSTGLKNCNTTYPFEAGSCRIDVSDNYMIIRTCHKMYKSSDGYYHQANVTIQADIDKMEITDSYTEIMNPSYGYVSHSFNQFVKIEDGHIIALDHGDAYPRAFVILKYKTDINNGTFTPSWESLCTEIPVLEFEGSTGNNTTGASVGGFELSDDHYLAAANTVTQDSSFSSYKTRNVFVAAVDKSTSEVTTNYLTNYDEGEETTTTPQLVKISGTRFMVLWTKGDQVYTAIVDNSGQKVGEIQHFTGSLSDCQPVVSNGKVVWYTWKNGDINFYDVNTSDLTDYNVTEIHNGHQYVYDPDSDTDDTITFRCKECDAVKTQKKITLTRLYWKYSEATDEYYHTRENGWNQKTGTTMTSLINYTPTTSDANTELEVTSTDENVISVEKTSGIDLKLIARKAGTSTVTIKPKYNQTNVKTYKITVYDPLQITKFEADTTTPKIGDKVQLSVETKDGSGKLQYKFYEENEKGDQTQIQDYSAKAACEWTPTSLGNHTLYVEVKDSEGNVEKKSLENITVVKKQTKIADINQSYCYTIGAQDQKINLEDYLPSDISNAAYEAEITNPSNKIVTESDKTDTSYSFNVSKAGKAGDQAKIQFTIKSDNYEDITFNVNITLTDKLSIVPKEDLTNDILHKSTLTYGEKISHLGFNSVNTKLETKDGEKIYGTFKFKNPDEIPDSGEVKIDYIFVPQNKNYKDYEGSVTVKVEKQTPILSGTGFERIIYDQNKKIKDIPLQKSAVALIGEKMQSVSGTWTIENKDQKLPLGEYQMVVKFTPDDTTNYTTAEINAEGQTFFEIYTDLESDSAKVGDTIQIYTNPETTDLQYRFYVEDAAGNQEVIRDNTSDSECKWIPEKEGTYTVCVEARDDNGNTATASVEEITINKKEEVKSPVKNPESGDHGSDQGEPNTNTNSDVRTGVKANQITIANGIIYKVTKIENTQNAQVTITSLDKKKSSFVIPDYIMVNGVKCKVVTISKKALYKGKKLKKLTICKNIQTIEDNAFNGCKNLKSITIKSTVLKKVGKNAIKGIHKKAVIKVPKKQYKKYKKLFGKKSGFKKPMKLKK